MRLAIGVEYLGKNYCGWQSQINGISVQSILEYAITYVASHPVKVQCAGRTDKGVHALEQVVHFDTSSKRDNSQWLLGINCNLPQDIKVKWVKPTEDEFHARFSAESRTYHYYIYNNPTPSAILADNMLWFPYGLDLDLMQQAALKMIGEHDFSSFRSSKCQAKSPIKTIYKLDIIKRNDNVIVVVIKANSFLYNMVRNILGVLLAVGKGKNNLDWVDSVIASRSRSSADVKISAKGLYFIKADYPDCFKLEQCVEKYLF